jgi:hypothetical protein
MMKILSEQVECKSEQESFVKDIEPSDTRKKSETGDNVGHDKDTFRANRESESEQESSVIDEENFRHSQTIGN